MQRGKLLFVILIAVIFGISLSPQHVQAAGEPAPRVFYFYYQFAPKGLRTRTQVNPTKWVEVWQDGSAYQYSLVGTSTVDGTTGIVVTRANDGQNVFIPPKGSSSKWLRFRANAATPWAYLAQVTEIGIATPASSTAAVQNTVTSRGAWQITYPDGTQTVRDGGTIVTYYPNGNSMTQSPVGVIYADPPAAPTGSNLAGFLNDINDDMLGAIKSLLNSNSDVTRYLNSEQGLSVYGQMRRRGDLIQFLCRL